MKLHEKLFLNTFKPDDRSHLAIIDRDVCLACEEKWCTRFCPAEVYHWNDDDRKIDITYEACLECGTCRIGCPYRNISWVYPRGGFGVQHRFG